MNDPDILWFIAFSEFFFPPLFLNLSLLRFFICGGRTRFPCSRAVRNDVDESVTEDGVNDNNNGADDVDIYWTWWEDAWKFADTLDEQEVVCIHFWI